VQGYRGRVSRLLGPGWKRDVAIALGLTVFEVAASFGASGHAHPHRKTDVLGAALIAISTLSLAGRLRWPRAVLAVVFAATLAYTAIGYQTGPDWPALIVAFVTAVATGHRAFGIATIVIGWAAFLWLPRLVNTGKAPTVGHALALIAWLLLLLAVGEVIRSRQERGAQARRVREEEARRRAGEERLLIARELHDVLAHNISLISVQAGVALHLMDERPEQARTALEAIRHASGETLREMRAVLDVLRADERAPRAPTAGLARLREMVERTAAGGLRVDLEIEGEPRELPAGVDLAAFRIVQEALTNVTRHARAARVTVRLTYGEDEVTVQVDDDGAGGVAASPSDGGGNGIPGMRERAAALGGELQAGPREGGGFRVRARLPA
jgi:signal transduction histidine kinase